MKKPQNIGSKRKPPLSPLLAKEGMGRSQILKYYNKLFPFISLVGLLAVWELGVRASGIPKWILPRPSLILAALWDTRALIWHHAVPTILEAMTGLASAVAVGAACACLIEWSAVARRILYPLLVVTQTIPTIAIAPLLVIWFGFGMVSKIVIIALVCFFPIAVNMADGFRATDPEWLKIFRAMGARRGQIFRRVLLPAALPGFFTGFKIAGAYSVLGAVIAEWFGAEKGLGILLMRSAKSYLTERVFATIIIVTVLSLLLVSLIEALARLSIPWHYTQKERQ